MPKLLPFALALALAAGLGSVPAVAQAPSGDLETARSLSRAFAAVARRVTPAVVNISSTRVERGRTTSMSPFARRLFPDLVEPDRTVASLGSGVLIRPDGYIVTNCHVIEGAQETRVTLADNTEYDATVVGQDGYTDLAVIKIPATNLPYAAFGNADQLEVGEWVIAVGSPMGLAQTVTQGIVSAKGRRNIGLQGYEDFIQTDAAINPGNSGGALVNLDGLLVGINTAIASEGGGYDGICFATPSAIVRSVVDALIRDGKIVRPWLGIRLKTVDRNLAARLALNVTSGVMIDGMVRSSPAHQAGLRPGDVVSKWNDQEVKTAADLSALIQATPVGTEATLVVLRGGQAYRAPVTVQQRPPDVQTGGIQ